MPEAAKTPVTQRVEFVDTARGVAMLCIVLGHLGLAPVNFVVYTFHVPIFFLITGWFVSRRLLPGAYAKKRARTLLVPYAATCLVLIIVQTVAAGVAGGLPGAGEAALRWTASAVYGAGSDNVTMPAAVSSIGAIWFLWACFWGCVGLRLLLQLRREWLRALIVFALETACVLSARYWYFLPFDLQPGGIALAFMYLGYLARTYAWPRVQAWPRGAKVACVCAAAVAWVAYILWQDSVIIVEALPGQRWWSVFGILCGCLTVLVLCWLLTKAAPKVARPLMFLGKYSLIMLCVHLLEMFCIDYAALVAALGGLGVPYLVAGGCALALKLAIIIGFTVLLANWGPSRRLFGFGNA